MSTMNEQVAEEVRVLLARKRLTASELARMTGMTQRAISRRLTGEKVIDVDDLDKIARALGVQVTDLLPATVRPNNRSAAQSVRMTRERVRVKTRPNGRPVNESTRPVSPERLTQRRPVPLNRPMAAR